MDARASGAGDQHRSVSAGRRSLPADAADHRCAGRVWHSLLDFDQGHHGPRDLPLLSVASRAVPVSMGVSIALLDETIHAALEPGTPSPRARLELVRAIVQAGLPCQVLVAPILPMITDSDEQVDALLEQIAAAGATGATVFALHLRPGAREWFLRYLGTHHPQLVGPYAQLYRKGSYVTRSYAAGLARRSAVLLRKHGLDRRDSTLRMPDTRAAPIPPHLAALSEPSLF
jgi:hypothetical protein